MTRKYILNNSRNYFIDLLINRIIECEKDIIDQWQNPCGTNTRHFFIDDVLPNKDVQNIYSAFINNSKVFHVKTSFREKKERQPSL